SGECRPSHHDAPRPVPADHRRGQSPSWPPALARNRRQARRLTSQGTGAVKSGWRHTRQEARIRSQRLLKQGGSVLPAGLLAVMVHERPPLKMEDLPGMIVSWLQDAGGYAAVGLAIWLVAYVLQRRGYVGEQQPIADVKPWPRWFKWLFIFFVC